MTPRLNKIFTNICALIVIACFCPRAFAFVLQGPHILELMADKMGQAESLYISQKVTFYNISPTPETGESAAEEETGIIEEDIGPSGDDPTAESFTPPAEYEPQITTVEMEESLRYLFP